MKTAQLIYLMICVGLPYVPHVCLRPRDGIHHHCRCSSYVWVVPASPPNSVTDYTIARNVLMYAWSCVRQWCPYSEMMACFARLQIFWVVDLYGMFGVFHYAKILPRCIGCYINGSDLDDALFEAELFLKQAPDFNSHRKSLLKINANHADDFQGDWYF